MFKIIFVEHSRLHDIHLRLAVRGACDVVEGVGVAVVLQGPGFDPAVSERAVHRVSDARRRFHLGVEVAVVDGGCVGRQPPKAGADFFVGGVEGYGPIDGHSPNYRNTQPASLVIGPLHAVVSPNHIPYPTGYRASEVGGVE